MIKKTAVFVLVLFLLSGCSGIESKKTGTVIVDALGREVSFSNNPLQIVIAGKQTPTLANFAYMFAGEVEKILAIENRSQSSNKFLSLIDPQFESKLIIEKGAAAEQIAPMEPDAVILKSSMKEQIGDQLELVGIPLVYVSFETIDEIYRDVRIFGVLLNDQETSQKIIDFFSRSKDAIDKMVATSNSYPKALILQIDQSEEAFIYSVPAVDWLQTTMVEELNGMPVWKEDTSAGGWMEVGLEQIIAWQPEIIIVVNYQGQSLEIINKIKNDAVWSEFLDTSSVEIKPFVYDFQSWDQPDPRWILGYANLAQYLHPQVVPANFLYGLVQDFYKDLYGLDLDFIESEIIPLITQQIEIE